MSTSNDKRPESRRQEWSPHMWEGCHFLAWARLLIHNRFQIGLRYWWVAAIITFVSFCHTALTILQDCWYGAQITRTPIKDDPIFIIGHWRTGTTLLHEYLILDERHNYPNTYECLEPNHFLLTERFFQRWVRFLTPSHRPMDNMKAGWERPQEDEFALCMLGLPSPYLTIAFPNRPPQFAEYLDLEGLSPRDLATWKRRVRGGWNAVALRAIELPRKNQDFGAACPHNVCRCGSSSDQRIGSRSGSTVR